MSVFYSPFLNKKFIHVLFIGLILLYGLHYAGIKILPNFQGKVPAKTSENSYDTQLYEDDFAYNWCESSRKRTDWKSMIRPCSDLLSWESKSTLPETLETDADKSFISGKNIRPAGEYSRISIATKSRNGMTKTIGGDSWRVKVNGTATVSARVIDHSNGTYDVVFLFMDKGVFYVHIYLDYSLCNGLRDPPKDWFKKGNSQGKYQMMDVIGKPKDLLMHPLKNTPIKIEIKARRHDSTENAPECKDVCRLLWDGRGRWINSTWFSYFKDASLKSKTNAMSQRKRGNLLVYGDSVNVFFAQSIKHRGNICKDVFNSCNFVYNWIYQVRNVSMAKTKRDSKDIDIEKILDDFKNTVMTDVYNNEASVVIVNFGLHFVESTNFSNYQRLIKELAMFATEKNDLGHQNFQGKIIWKTTTAINKERADFPQLHWRRFFTNYRIQLYNVYAMDVMCKHGIPLIDAYPISESYPYGTGTHAGRSPSRNDIVHYNNEAFYPIERFIEEHFKINM